MAALTPAQIEYYAAREDETLQPDLLAISSISIVFGFLAIGLRFASRKIMHAYLGADDYLILLALAPMMALNIGTIFGVSIGMGRHILFVEDFVGMMKLGLSNILCYSVATCFTKLSLLALYFRVFPTKTVKFLCSGLGIFVILYSAALIGISTGRCQPLNKIWRPTIDGTCVNPAPAFMTLAVANAVTDVVMLVLPATNVWKLKLSKARKISVLVIFLLGGVVCIFGIVRIVAVAQAAPPDITWTEARGGLWSQVELMIAVICACLPTYRPIFQKSLRASHREERLLSLSKGYTKTGQSVFKDDSQKSLNSAIELQKQPAGVCSSVQALPPNLPNTVDDGNIHVKREVVLRTAAEN